MVSENTVMKTMKNAQRNKRKSRNRLQLMCWRMGYNVMGKNKGKGSYKRKRVIDYAEEEKG